ncbi:MAG: hypothetical protein JW816_00560 [Candidatus Buchananbacteria bacterium]|nr:hypothetical protein [Candidatus Buchananbacteria bacterium]
MLPLLDFAKSTFLSDEITKFLKNRNAENYFTLLTTPIKQTMAKRQEIDLYKIILLIEKNREVYNLFSNGGASEIADQLPKLNKTIWQKINNHTRKYTWIYYVYEGPPANQAYFIDLIRDYIRRGVKAKKEILKNEQELSKLKQSQLKILKRLEPNNYERQIILLGRDAVYYKMHRRELQTQSYYYFEPVLSEIGRRLHLTLRQVRTMLPIEIESSLISGLANTEQINQRLKLVCYIRESQKLSVLVGKKANDFTKLIKEKKINKNIKEIHGTTAQEGKVSGAVKVINAPEEMSKMNRGDILVSSATSPNLMPAIRQAAGIITDEGGLTCHAAIVSREFKIPCVVGTGFATRILKDGDMVEVDADKGVVRKI